MNNVNGTVRELHLSNNKVGSAEELNAVKPDVVTGSEALADLLRTSHCVLQVLHLEWNMIRLDGGIDLCRALACNSSLMTLNLDNNSLDHKGGVTLGESLNHNRTLKKLLIANNSIDSLACLTICAGIIENESLTKVSLDSNPIGLLGARAVLLIPNIIGSRVALSVTRCNTKIRQAKADWEFDFDRLTRDFSFNMEIPYERAAAVMLLHIVACDTTLTFESITHNESTSLHLVRAQAQDRDEYFNDKDR